MRTITLLTAVAALAAAGLPLPIGAFTSAAPRADHCQTVAAAFVSDGPAAVATPAGLLPAARAAVSGWSDPHAKPWPVAATTAFDDLETPLSAVAMAARVAGYRAGIDGGTSAAADSTRIRLIAARPPAAVAR